MAEVPAWVEWLLSIAGAFILLLLGVVRWLWTWRDSTQQETDRSVREDMKQLRADVEGGLLDGMKGRDEIRRDLADHKDYAHRTFAKQQEIEQIRKSIEGLRGDLRENHQETMRAIMQMKP